LAPGLAQPEQLLPTLAERLFSRFWYAVFSCALLAAILSTINSVLLACAGLLSHNVVNPLFGFVRERQRLYTARWLVVVVGAFSLWIALYANGVYELIELASSFGTAGIVVTTLAALFSPWGGKWSAAAALLLGLVTMPVAEALELPAPFLASVAAAAGGYVLVAVWLPSRHGEVESSEQLAMGVTDPGE
jgi:Na+/proline symporter